MRIGVIGAGAVGGAIAALLARAGHDVEVTARGDHLAAIRESGIRLEGGWGTYTAAVSAAELLTAPADLVIIATKAQDAASALCANLAIAERGPILVVQNGLDGISTASAIAPGAAIAGGLAMFAASYLSAGTVTITTPGPTYLGGPAARSIAELIGDAVPVEVVDNFDGALWTKLFVNQVNALPAITGLHVQEVAADPGLLRVLTASMRETVRTGLALGIRFAPLQGLSHARLRLFAALPAALAQRLPLLMASRMGVVPNPGSTLQSIRRGQKTEVDYLNGAVVAHAAAGTAPVNAAIVGLVHEVEETGVFLAPDKVVARALPR
jgi:2-dehydropantoate 2-reductase